MGEASFNVVLLSTSLLGKSGVFEKRERGVDRFERNEKG